VNKKKTQDSQKMRDRIEENKKGKRSALLHNEMMMLLKTNQYYTTSLSLSLVSSMESHKIILLVVH
jgi:hypothetical protein